jgi:Transposase, Mutator family
MKEVNTGADAQASAATRPPTPPVRKLRTERSETPEYSADSWEACYPAIVKLWRAHWAEFTPFLVFSPEVRRVVHITNLIESMNARLRKVTRIRGQFPSEQATLKVLYLAVRNLEEIRRPSVGIRNSRWKQALPGVRHLLRGPNPDPHDRCHDHLHRRSDAPAPTGSASGEVVMSR